MQIIDGHIVFGMRECRRCWGEGTVAKRQACPKCHGTGNGPRGGHGGCRTCYGSGARYDHNVQETCPTCEGVNSKAFEAEDICDRISDDDWRAFEFRVYRSNRPQTWGEAYMGAGVFSCTDYGVHKELSDDALIADVRERAGSVQAIKVADKDTLKVADHIGIFTNHNGYSVIAVHEEA